jgi:rubrerythrin
MIIKCKCEHKDQDKFHGRFMRVHNPLAKAKSSTTQKWRCTVCGDVKEEKENG